MFTYYSRLAAFGFQASPHVTKCEKVTLKVYNLYGRLVKLLIDQEQNAGIYNVELDGTGWSSGVYFIIVELEGRIVIRKAIILK